LFGSVEGHVPVAGTGVIAQPLVGCETLTNAVPAEDATKPLVYVVQRGVCQFSQKAMAAQLAGAAALLVLGIETGIEPVLLAAGEPFTVGGKVYTAANVTIPVHYVPYDVGEDLLGAMAAQPRLRLTLGMPGWDDLQRWQLQQDISGFGTDVRVECIDQSRVCDGVWDCRGGADETSCVTESWPVTTVCRIKRNCLHQVQPFALSSKARAHSQSLHVHWCSICIFTDPRNVSTERVHRSRASLVTSQFGLRRTP
jgi:hypothetical protein